MTILNTLLYNFATGMQSIIHIREVNNLWINWFVFTDELLLTSWTVFFISFPHNTGMSRCFCSLLLDIADFSTAVDYLNTNKLIAIILLGHPREMLRKWYGLLEIFMNSLICFCICCMQQANLTVAKLLKFPIE